jgi:hypothetical protein
MKLFDIGLEPKEQIIRQIAKDCSLYKSVVEKSGHDDLYILLSSISPDI